MSGVSLPLTPNLFVVTIHLQVFHYIDGTDRRVSYMDRRVSRRVSIKDRRVELRNGRAYLKGAGNGYSTDRRVSEITERRDDSIRSGLGFSRTVHHFAQYFSDFYLSPWNSSSRSSDRSSISFRSS